MGAIGLSKYREKTKQDSIIQDFEGIFTLWLLRQLLVNKKNRHQSLSRVSQPSLLHPLVTGVGRVLSLPPVKTTDNDVGAELINWTKSASRRLGPG